jgi:hypothetical protein
MLINGDMLWNEGLLLNFTFLLSLPRITYCAKDNKGIAIRTAHYNSDAVCEKCKYDF